MNAKHTLGPWEIRERGEIWQNGNDFTLPGIVATVTDFNHPSARADARLIAAAPEMHEIIRRLNEVIHFPLNAFQETAWRIALDAESILKKMEG